MIDEETQRKWNSMEPKERNKAISQEKALMVGLETVREKLDPLARNSANLNRETREKVEELSDSWDELEERLYKDDTNIPDPEVLYTTVLSEDGFQMLENQINMYLEALEDVYDDVLSYENSPIDEDNRDPNIDEEEIDKAVDETVPDQDRNTEEARYKGYMKSRRGVLTGAGIALAGVGLGLLGGGDDNSTTTIVNNGTSGRDPSDRPDDQRQITDFNYRDQMDLTTVREFDQHGRYFQENFNNGDPLDLDELDIERLSGDNYNLQYGGEDGRYEAIISTVDDREARILEQATSREGGVRDLLDEAEWTR